MRPYVTSEVGVKLLTEFVNSRQGLNDTRAKLVAAIDNDNTKEINQNFRTLEIQTENSSAAILDFTNYNLHTLERTQLVYKEIIS